MLKKKLAKKIVTRKRIVREKEELERRALQKAAEKWAERDPERIQLFLGTLLVRA